MKKEMRPASNQAEEYFRPQGASKYLHISRRCLSEWQQRRIVPYSKIGAKCVLFKKTDLDAAMARFRVAAIGENGAV